METKLKQCCTSIIKFGNINQQLTPERTFADQCVTGL